jgi:hypothetical protein
MTGTTLLAFWLQFAELPDVGAFEVVADSCSNDGLAAWDVPTCAGTAGEAAAEVLSEDWPPHAASVADIKPMEMLRVEKSFQVSRCIVATP